MRVHPVPHGRFFQFDRDTAVTDRLAILMRHTGINMQYLLDNDGVSLFTDTGVTPLPDQLSHFSIGYDKTTGANGLNMCIQRFRWYKTKMAEAALQAATL